MLIKNSNLNKQTQLKTKISLLFISNSYILFQVAAIRPRVRGMNLRKQRTKSNFKMERDDLYYNSTTSEIVHFFTTVNCCWNSISTKIIPSIYLITIFYTSIFIFINVCIFIFKLFRRTFYLFLLWFCSSRSSCFFYLFLFQLLHLL